MTGPLRLGALGALLALLLLLAPAAARAADPVTGGMELTLGGSAATSLKRAGVRFVAVEPATVTRSALTLPASTATLGDTTRAYHSGVVQLVRGKGSRARRIALTGAQTRLAGRASTSARLGTRRVALLTFGAAKPVIDPAAGTARLTATASLTRAAAAVLRKRLRLERLPAGRLGKATMLIARPSALPPVAAPGAPAAGTPGTGSTPGANPGTNACVAPAPGGNVGAAAITWRARDSWIRYTATGEGSSAACGSTLGPKEVRPPSTASLPYTFGYPFAGGDAAPGSTLLRFGGSVVFSYKAHTIDMSFSNPQLTLGSPSSLTFTVDNRGDATPAATTRMFDLDLAAATRTVDGATETYTDIPATITQEGAAAFLGFYQPGEPWGSVSASFTRTP